MWSRFSFRMAVVAGLVLAGALPVIAANGDVSRDELDALEAERAQMIAQLQALETAEGAAVSDLAGLERDLIAAAMESRRREEQATASELKLLTLRARLGAARRDMLEGEDALETLMASLVVSGRHQPPALLASAGDANAAVRSAIIMGDVTPRLKARTTLLGQEIDQLRKLERMEAGEQARLETAEAALSLKQAEIVQMTAIRRAAFEDVSGHAAALRTRAELLGREAETVRGLLAALEARAPDAPGTKPVLQYASLSPNTGLSRPEVSRPAVMATGALGTRPAAGRIIRQWGDRMSGGAKSEGTAIATRAQAQVAAPVDGRIEFAGPFRTYGQLLIISTSDGYHVLLSGMDEAYVGVGQVVKRGEPVARMQNRANPEPELYMEVRKDGKPTDPAQWMRGS